jgi:hypothetical protein
MNFNSLSDVLAVVASVVMVAEMPRSVEMSTETKVTLLFAGIVAISTVVYSVLTCALVWETRRMRRLQSEPHLGLELVENWWSLGLADLVIRNDGAGPALNIQFEVVTTAPEADREILQRLNELSFVKNGLAYLSPKSEVKTYLGRIVGRTEQSIKTHVHLRMRYESAAREPHEDCYAIDLEQFWNRFRAGSPPLHQIADELVKIRQIVEKRHE